MWLCVDISFFAFLFFHSIFNFGLQTQYHCPCLLICCVCTCFACEPYPFWSPNLANRKPIQFNPIQSKHVMSKKSNVDKLIHKQLLKQCYHNSSTECLVNQHGVERSRTVIMADTSGTFRYGVFCRCCCCYYNLSRTKQLIGLTNYNLLATNLSYL